MLANVLLRAVQITEQRGCLKAIVMDCIELLESVNRRRQELEKGCGIRGMVGAWRHFPTPNQRY
jgi:hypothetical protein